MPLGRPWQWLWQPLDCGAKCFTPLKANDGRYNHPRLGRIWNSNILKTENLNWIIATWQEVPWEESDPGGLSLQLSMLDKMLMGSVHRVFFRTLSAMLADKLQEKNMEKIMKQKSTSIMVRPSIRGLFFHVQLSNCPNRCWGTDFQTVDSSLGWSFGLGDSPKQRRRTIHKDVPTWTRCGNGAAVRVKLNALGSKSAFFGANCCGWIVVWLDQGTWTSPSGDSCCLTSKDWRATIWVGKICEWCTSKPHLQAPQPRPEQETMGNPLRNHKLQPIHLLIGEAIGDPRRRLLWPLRCREERLLRAPHWAAVLASCWSASRWADTSTRQHNVSRMFEKVSGLSKRPSTFALAKAEVIWEARSST